MRKVFLSYSKKDLTFALLAQAKLKEAQIEVWRDYDDIPAGEDWRQEIDKGISE
ncbi:toll/interleukin-1 receptor domain-containing protein, partial [Roseiarcus sp.]|uniref:toll/interleukin-1 receptor domain-containing protein n=1 Tax=Roseiarcus sp. TaxID=1969460 RepID=UPI003D10C646